MVVGGGGGTRHIGVWGIEQTNAALGRSMPGCVSVAIVCSGGSRSCGFIARTHTAAGAPIAATPTHQWCNFTFLANFRQILIFNKSFKKFDPPNFVSNIHTLYLKVLFFKLNLKNPLRPIVLGSPSAPLFGRLLCCVFVLQLLLLLFLLLAVAVLRFCEAL